MYLGTNTLNFVKSKSMCKYSSKKKYKQVQVQMLCKKIKYKYKELEKFSLVQPSTSNAIFMFHNCEGQSDEHTKAAVLCIY